MENAPNNQLPIEILPEGPASPLPYPGQAIFHCLPHCVQTIPAASIQVDSDCPVYSYDLGDLSLESSGTLLSFQAKLHDVLPERDIAVFLLLQEMDSHGEVKCTYNKTFVVPAHHATDKRDIMLKQISFVVPSSQGITCEKKRNFTVRMVAQYLCQMCENTITLQ